MIPNQQSSDMVYDIHKDQVCVFTETSTCHPGRSEAEIRDPESLMDVMDSIFRWNDGICGNNVFAAMHNNPINTRVLLKMECTLLSAYAVHGHLSLLIGTQFHAFSGLK